MPPGRFRVVAWNTVTGREHAVLEATATGLGLTFSTSDLAGDRAFAIRRVA